MGTRNRRERNEVADAMGHANTKLVLSTYGHALPEKRAAVFAKLGARIFGEGRAP